MFDLKLQFFRFFNQNDIYISTETRIFVSVYKYACSDMRNSNGETTAPENVFLTAVKQMRLKDFFTDDGIRVNWPKLDAMPEFVQLASAKQSKQWHKEGTALIHTKLVTNHMIELTDGMRDEDRRVLVVAAILHDIGKGSTTKFDKNKGDYTSKNHGPVGERIARGLLYDEEFLVRERICDLVRRHMHLHHLFDHEDKIDEVIISLSYGYATVRDFIYLWQADSLGSISGETEEQIMETRHLIMGIADRKLKCIDRQHKFKDTFKQRYFLKMEPSKPPKLTFKAYIMIGLPGSGKNHYIDNNLPHLPSLSRDDIRAEIGLGGEKPQGNKQEEETVTRMLMERLERYCESETSFVINNVNAKLKYRQDFLRKLIQHKAEIIYVYIDTPIEICKKRRKGQIPEGVIDRMNEHFDMPSPREYDSIIVVRGDASETFDA